MKQNGFTLLEILIALALLAVVGGAIMTSLHQGQVMFQAERELNDSTDQARIAMDQVVRYLRDAGNDPYGYLASNGIPAVELLGQNHIRVNSDVTGTVASTTGVAAESTGDPDGQLASIHERVIFRYDPNGQRLLVDVGYGTEEVLAENISCTFVPLNSAGSVTAASGDVARVKVRMVAQSADYNLMSGNRSGVALDSDVYLRSKSFRVFGMASPLQMSSGSSSGDGSSGSGSGSGTGLGTGR